MTRPKFIDDLSADYVSERLAYDPATGAITLRRPSKMGRPTGTRAEFKFGRGYLGVALKDRIYSAHRIAWLITYGRWPTGEIDHINRDKSDNRLSNLRDVPKSINGHNKGPSRRNSSGFKGVSLTRSGTWNAQIKVDGRRHNLGTFKTKEAAAEAYRIAAARLVHQPQS